MTLHGQSFICSLFLLHHAGRICGSHLFLLEKSNPHPHAADLGATSQRQPCGDLGKIITRIVTGSLGSEVTAQPGRENIEIKPLLSSLDQCPPSRTRLSDRCEENERRSFSLFIILIFFFFPLQTLHRFLCSVSSHVDSSSLFYSARHTQINLWGGGARQKPRRGVHLSSGEGSGDDNNGPVS